MILLSSITITYNMDNWAYIKQCIDEAKGKKVEQPQMADFLKKAFTSALDALEDLVKQGIDLADRSVVKRLKGLELDLHQIPQNRVRAFDGATVLEDFDEYFVRFYKLLSVPKQDAETSFSCRWVVGRIDSALEEIQYLKDSIDILDNVLISMMEFEGKDIDSLKEEFGCEREILEQWKEKTVKSVARALKEIYLEVCDNLNKHGSDMIRASLADSIEALANALTSEDMLQDASTAWDLAITLLSQEDDLRITQRKERLKNAKQKRHLMRQV